MRYLIFFMFIFLGATLNAQVKDYIKGKVVDEQKNPVSFAYIVINQNSKQIAVTVADVDGNYILGIPDTLKNFTITVVFVGMESKKINVTRKTNKR